MRLAGRDEGGGQRIMEQRVGPRVLGRATHRHSQRRPTDIGHLDPRRHRAHLAPPSDSLHT